MQEKLKDNQAPSTSRASSFFIENILSKGWNDQGSASYGGRGIAGVETNSSGRVPNAHYADASAVAAEGSSSTVRSAYTRSPVQWYRGGTDLDFRAFETPQSEYRVTKSCENRRSFTRGAYQRLATHGALGIFYMCSPDWWCNSFMHTVYRKFLMAEFCNGRKGRELSYEL